MQAVSGEQSIAVSAAPSSRRLSGQLLLQVESVTKAMQVILLSLVLGGSALAEVGTTVYLSEPNVVLEPISDINGVITYPDIMVGTKLAIVVDSNQEGRWHGGFFIEGSSLGYGLLSGRDYNDVTLDWEGSRYPAAGTSRALVFDGSDIVREGFYLYADGGAVTGDWFAIDYVAASPGPCTAYLCYYEYEYPWPPDPMFLPEEFLIQELTFSHVLSRDFDGNGAVELNDCAILAACWNMVVSDPNGPCAVDLSGDALVNFVDFAMFADFWLERTEY